MRSSTTFQMLLHLGAYLAAAFAIIEIAIILYKIIGMYSAIHPVGRKVLKMMFREIHSSGH